MEIKTERLFLRPIQIDDAEPVFQYRSNSLVNKYQGWIPSAIEDVVSFIENKSCPVINITGTWFQFVIIETKWEQMIGDIGIHFVDAESLQAEIGCTLDIEYHGKGYATEALRSVIPFLFLDLGKHRLTASIDPQNIKSINLFERLDFRREAHFKESILINGEWKDDLIYAVLKDEWFKNNL